MNVEASREFTQHVDDFRRGFLVRAVGLLGATVWMAGMGVLLVDLSPRVVVTVLSFEAICWLAFRLARPETLRLASHLFVGGFVLWSLALVWLVRDPVLIFIPIVAASVGVAVLAAGPAVIYALITIFGQIISMRLLFPGIWLDWHWLLAPFLSLLTLGLALIWNLNLHTILVWALHSTRTAVERLEEVQAHRAHLHKNMEELDAACQRLERLNEMLAAARAEAEAAHHARNQFALTVSHELRTPLNFIIGFSELMVNAPGTYGELEAWPPGLYEDIREIYHSSNHLLRLVTDILELGQADAHRLVLTKEWTTPAQIVQETEAIIRTAVAAQRLTLAVELEPGLPELFVDRTRIRQVLINLLSNSLRFTEQGGITLAVSQAREEVIFCVRDTGAGIPAEDIPRVFESFGQANATVWRRRGGSGLGVPISRRFVEMHGGRMWLESQVGQGTSFYFTLPKPGAAPEPLPAAQPEEDAFWYELVGQPRALPVLLVLSPDPNAADLAAGYVDGYRVVATTQAGLARQHANSLLPQALVIDQAIASQPEVLSLIATLPYDLPVIVFPLPGSRVPSGELPEGVSQYLVKPVLREDLVYAIRSAGAHIRSLLVVDDDPAMARFVSLALAASEDATLRQADGAIHVLAAATGREALACLQELAPEKEAATKPGMILLDLGLPDMSGWEVLDGLRAAPAWRDIPVILTTAASLPEEMDARERKAIHISTSRPLTADELAMALKALLQAVQPRFPISATAPGQTTNPSA